MICSLAFPDEVITLVEFVYSVSTTFLKSRDFEIHVNESSNGGFKFTNPLSLLNISRHQPTSVDIFLNIIITPSD